jgi:hypothetical protein
MASPDFKNTSPELAVPSASAMSLPNPEHNISQIVAGWLSLSTEMQHAMPTESSCGTQRCSAAGCLNGEPSLTPAGERLKKAIDS